MRKHLLDPNHDQVPGRMVKGFVGGFLAGYAAIYVAAILIGLLLAGAMLLFGSCLAAMR